MTTQGDASAGAVLLTGAPGAGKTTIANRLQEQDPESFHVLRFGPLVYEAVRRRTGDTLSYETFRSSSARVVTSDDIEVATRQAATITRRQTEEGSVTIIDSHAVSKETYGWRGVPDSPRLLSSFGYSLIVQLHVPPALTLERLKKSRGGRLLFAEDDVAMLQDLQAAVSIYYAATLGCPLHVVSNVRRVDSTVETVRRLFQLQA